MAGKKRTLSQTPGKTPTSVLTPKNPRGRGRPIKLAKNSSPEDTNSSSDANDLNTLASKDAEPKLKKTFFPFDKVELASTIEGTIKGVQEAVQNVLDDHVLRCTVPVDKMAAISTRLLKLFADRRMERAKGNDFVLGAPLDEAFSEISEEDVTMDKSIFRIELMKYILIGASKFDCLSTEVCLSIVENLHAYGMNMSDYETGSPTRVASTIEQFFGLTRNEFATRTKQQQLRMEIEYIREKLRWTKDMAAYLNEKHKQLIKAGNADPMHLFKDWPEGRVKQDALVDAFRRNTNTARELKMEYERLISQEEVLFGPYRGPFRKKMMKGRTGVRTQKEEDELEICFAKTPIDVIKALIEEDEENADVRMPDELSKKNKAEPLEYKHKFVPTPSIHLHHDPF